MCVCVWKGFKYVSHGKVNCIVLFVGGLANLVGFLQGIHNGKPAMRNI